MSRDPDEFEASIAEFIAVAKSCGKVNTVKTVNHIWVRRVILISGGQVAPGRLFFK